MDTNFKTKTRLHMNILHLYQISIHRSKLYIISLIHLVYPVKSFSYNNIQDDSYKVTDLIISKIWRHGKMVYTNMFNTKRDIT